jgi:hypothetical protein
VEQTPRLFIVGHNLYSKFNLKMSNSLAIKKPYCRQFPGLTMAGFVDALKLEKINGMHFKRWQVKVMLTIPQPSYNDLLRVGKIVKQRTISRYRVIPTNSF